MAWVYILKTKSGKYYVGSTTNLEKRLQQHLAGSTHSTKRLKAEHILFSQEYQTLKEARFIESKIKKMKRRDYIEKILNDGYIRTKPP